MKYNELRILIFKRLFIQKYENFKIFLVIRENCPIFALAITEGTVLKKKFERRVAGWLTEQFAKLSTFGSQKFNPIYPPQIKKFGV